MWGKFILPGSQLQFRAELSAKMDMYYLFWGDLYCAEAISVIFITYSALIMDFVVYMYRLDVNQYNQPSYYWNPGYILLKPLLFTFGSISSSIGLNPGSCMIPHTNLWEHHCESDKIYLYRPFWVIYSFEQLWCLSEILPLKRKRSVVTSCSVYAVFISNISKLSKAEIWCCSYMNFSTLFFLFPLPRALLSYILRSYRTETSVQALLVGKAPWFTLISKDKILGPAHRWTEAPYFKLLSENFQTLRQNVTKIL